MMVAPARRLSLLLAMIALAGCGDDGVASTCGDRLSCQELADQPEWMAGSMEAVPDDFPAAPAGAELCGQADGPTIYWLIDNTFTVHEHYRAALTAAGWTATGPVSAIDSPDAGATCATEQGFTTGDPLVLVQVYPHRSAFSLSLLNIEN